MTTNTKPGRSVGMIKLVGSFTATVMAVLTLPLLAMPGSGSITHAAPYACGQLAVILDTIRTLESNGNYQAKAVTATASGAYQYIDSTWQHWAASIGIDTQLYPTARSAPDNIQDRVAAANVTAILDDHHGDITIVPVIWYLPAALDNPALMDQIPAGNTLTIRQYQTRWLDTYKTKLGQAAPINANDCAPTTNDGAWALPAPRHQIDPGSLDNAHHDYPAWDLLLPINTPIYAITGGTVITTQHWNGNWWRDGCASTNPPNGCNTCGNGATIETIDGLRHTYCHNTQLYIAAGETIVPGQHIADSGDTGRTGTPHLHLELHYSGTQRCPQPLITAIYNGAPIPAPASLPTSGCSF